MHIRILDRYIFQEILMTFLFSMCAFTAVFMGSGTLFRIAEFITEYGASLASVAKIFVLSLPGVITGITMVFVPSVSTFVISQMLGGGRNPL